VEAPTKTDVLKPDEAKSVQEGAAEMAGDRKRFLMSSLGRAMSASTEVLQDMVMTIYDGAKKVVGLGTGERPKVDLPQDAPKGSNGSSDLPTGMVDPTDLPRLAMQAKDGGMTAKDLPAGMLDPAKIAGVMKDLPPDVTDSRDISKGVKALADAGLKAQD